MSKKTVSHFQILEPLGAGGMGRVYKGYDTKLKRTVALKFVSHQLIEKPEAQRRLLREARAAAALNHSNICTIYEVDEVQTDLKLETGEQMPAGTPFIAMELIDGKPLDRVLSESGPLPIDECLDMASQVAEGLAEAHSQGIVHRDLKPQNVVVTSRGQVKILDFGLAKPVAPTVPADSVTVTAPLTHEGALLGTTPYMSPEQASGKTVDSRSDIFSFGVMLYEMLAGQKPFQGQTAAEVLGKIMEAEPAPLAESRAGLPEDLERIARRCLRKKAEGRYNDTRDLVAALQDLRSRLSTRGPERLPAPADPAAMSVAVADFRDLGSGDETTSAGMTELVNIGLVEASPIRVVSPEYLRDLRRRLFGSGLGRIEDDQALEVARESGATLLLVGSIGGDEASRFVAWRLVDTRTGRSVGAGKQEGDALTVLADGIVEATSPVIGRVSGVEATGARIQVGELSSESPEAFKHYMAGIVFEERTDWEQARQEFERAVAIDSTFALAWFELGRVVYEPNQSKGFSAAKTFVGRAWELRDHLSVKDRMRVEAYRYGLESKHERGLSILEAANKRWPDDRQVLRDLVNWYSFIWDKRKAVEWAERGEILYPEDPVIVGGIYVDALMDTGKSEAAVHVARRMLALDPRDPARWSSLGRAFLRIGEPDSAIAAFQKATELSPETGSGWMIDCAFARGDLRTAIEQFRKEFEKGTWKGSGAQGRALIDRLIPFLVMAGRYEEANKALDGWLRGATYSKNPNPWLALVQGQMLLVLGRADEALALADDMSKRAETPRQHLFALRIRARALAALGKFNAAREAAAALHAGTHWGALALAEFIALHVDAEVAFGQGRPDSALVFLKRMRQQGTPDNQYLWDTHLREAQAKAYAMMGDLHAAAGAYEELLHIYGGDAPARYELAKVYQTLGRDREAVAEYRRFLDLWAEADEGLPQLADAKSRLAALTGG